jgi:inhibitor of cysteine peptidase
MKQLFTVFVLLSAIAGGLNSASAQNFVNLTKSDTGKTINLDTSLVLVITLPANPTTGYGWMVSTIDSTIIVQTGEREFVKDTSIKRMGQPGKQVLRFVGVSQGTANLQLQYKRAWEKTKAPAQVCNFTIVSNGKYTGSYTPPVKAVNTKN